MCLLLLGDITRADLFDVFSRTIYVSMLWELQGGVLVLFPGACTHFSGHPLAYLDISTPAQAMSLLNSLFGRYEAWFPWSLCSIPRIGLLLLCPPAI